MVGFYTKEKDAGCGNCRFYPGGSRICPRERGGDRTAGKKVLESGRSSAARRPTPSLELNIALCVVVVCARKALISTYKNFFCEC